MNFGSAPVASPDLPLTPKRTRLYLLVGAIAVVGVAAAGFVTLGGASVAIDSSRLVTVKRGTMVRSVVATGKVEPITKIEIKSKANGIIKVLRVNVDSVVAEANLLAARAALEGAQAQLKKNTVEALRYE